MGVYLGKKGTATLAAVAIALVGAWLFHKPAAVSTDIAQGPVSAPSADPLDTSENYAALDQKLGFQEFRLGTNESERPRDKLESKTFIGLAPSDESYYDLKAVSAVGSIEIKQILLTYKQALLQKITVTTDGYDSALALKAAFVNAYGPPTQEPHGSFITLGDTFEWDGDHCHLKLFIPNGGDGTAEFTSPDVDDVIQSRITSAKEVREQDAQSDASQNAKSL